MKAKKIVTQNSSAPQAATGPALRPARPTARIVHQTFNRIASDLDILQNSDASKSQLRESTAALFNIIEGAKYALLRLTGAPGIISQVELEQFCAESDEWIQLPFAVKMAVQRAPGHARHEKLNERFEAGAIVEPGRFLMYRDRTGVIVIVDSAKERTRAPRSPRGPQTTRTAHADTPTPAQLQAWFDLPSDRPPGESSPAAS